MSQRECIRSSILNIQFNDLLEFEFDQNEGIEIEGFAEDTIIKIRAQTITELEIRAQIALAKLSDWAQNSKLTFNETKTKCVLFAKNINYELPKIYLRGHELEVSKTFKYLGVYLDSKLNWFAHCNYIKS